MKRGEGSDVNKRMNESVVFAQGGIVPFIGDGRAADGRAADGLSPSIGETSETWHEYEQNSLRDGETFCVSLAELFDCLSRDEELRRKTELTEYVFADGRLCVNAREYVDVSDGEAVLTSYALSHADECFVKFERRFYTGGRSDTYADPCFDRTAGQIRTSLSRVHKIYAPQSKYFMNKEYLTEVNGDVAEFADMIRGKSVGEALKILIVDVMHRKYVDLEAETGLYEGALSKYVSGKRAPSVSSVAALCIYFHLPPQIFRILLDDMRVKLMDGSRSDMLLIGIVDSCWWFGDLAKINRSLVDAGEEPLTNLY